MVFRVMLCAVQYRYFVHSTGCAVCHVMLCAVLVLSVPGAPFTALSLLGPSGLAARSDSPVFALRSSRLPVSLGSPLA
jgi:hypothetical protein